MTDILATNIEEQEKEKADEVKRLKEKDDEDFVEILNTAFGRRFMFRMIDHADTLADGFVPGMPDVTNYNLGRQCEGKFWMNEMLRLAPDKYFQMCRERKSELVKREIIRINKEG